MSVCDIKTFCEEQRSWLNSELESDTEQLEEEGRRTSILSRLKAEEITLGLYARTVVRLCSIDDNPILPSHKFSPGDEVEIRSKSSKEFQGGVVSIVTEDSVSVALFGKKTSSAGEDSILGESPLALIPKSSVEVHRKMVQALKDLERHGVNHPRAAHVVAAAMEKTEEGKANVTPTSITPINEHLDSSQIEAVQFCLENRPIALIHGPPGTGKTTTVVELIQQAVQSQNLKVLVAAPSNVAVDNILAKLCSSAQTKSARKKRKQSLGNRIRAVRLGHPARLQADILPYSLEAQVQAADGTEIVNDVRKELESFVRVASNPKSRYSDKKTAYREIKSLRKEVRTREERVVESLLSNAQVVFATCVGAANKVLNDADFDLVIIDEAAQALEAACWIPALRGKKLVLAGDHCQLPPTIKSNRSDVKAGLGRTMFERVLELYGDTQNASPIGHISRMLKVQYRMHQEIAGWASQALYHDLLETAESVRQRTLSQLQGSEQDDDGIANAPLWLVDTAGCGLYESVGSSGSRFNTGEAQIVEKHVQALLRIGVPGESIAVISPYNGQVDILKASLLNLHPKLEIRSVDGFQGGEREAVILSLVRSSERGGKDGIGFLGDNRRLNVAVTRAKRHCCVVCDSDTVSQSSFIKGLVRWITDRGETRSALEYSPEQDAENLQHDLDEANLMLEHLLVEEAKKESSEKFASKPKEATRKSEQKSSEQHQQELVEKINEFVKAAPPGSDLIFSAELSSADRRVVHETAGRLGINHESCGTEGVDRRITLSIPTEGDPAAIDVKSNGVESNLTVTSDLERNLHQKESHANDQDEDINTDKNSLNNAGDTMINSQLGNLAKERKERRKKQSVKVVEKPQAQRQKKKRKGQKLGGNKKPVKDEPDLGLEELDDMAFLDAQIEKVQTSHGRTVQATGKNYRSVVNGILISKPKPVDKKRDARASASLQSKLKQAQADRRAKSKNKK